MFLYIFLISIFSFFAVVVICCLSFLQISYLFKYINKPQRVNLLCRIFLQISFFLSSAIFSRYCYLNERRRQMYTYTIYVNTRFFLSIAIEQTSKQKKKVNYSTSLWILCCICCCCSTERLNDWTCAPHDH